MRKLWLVLVLALFASTVQAQTVAQGAPGTSTDAKAWPFKIIFGGAQIDPRDTSDRSGRLLGRITFDGAQPVSQDTSPWLVSDFFTATYLGSIDSRLASVTNTNLQFVVDIGSVGGVAQAIGAGNGVPARLTDGATFYKGLTNTELRASAVPVSGTFFQATQPVSGTFWQATQPVSGTFFQATQPVSLASLPTLVAGTALIGKVGIDQTTPGTTNRVDVGNIPHVVVDTAPTTAVTGTFWPVTQPVSGTFWQATQPVSGTVTATGFPTTVGAAIAVRCVDTAGAIFEACGGSGGSGLTDTQLRATPVPVSGTVTATGPLTDTQLRATPVPVSGTVTANLGTIAGVSTETTLALVEAKMMPTASALTVLQNAATANGNGTAITVTGYHQMAVMYVCATICASSTTIFEGSIDGSTYILMSGWNTSTQAIGSLALGISTGTIYQFNVTGLQSFRARIATYGSGTITVSARALPGNAPLIPGTIPVSISAGNFPDNEPFNVAQFGGSAIATGAGAGGAGVPRVTVSNDSSIILAAGAATIGALTANQSTNVTQFAGTNASTGTGASGAGIPRVTVSNDSNIIITPPTLTKGTQGATGVSTQDLKDAGRNMTNYFMAAGIAGTAAEVMQSLTGYKAGAAVGATVTPAVVTAAKTYRITAITASYQSLAAAGGALIRLRANLSGTGVVTSPLVLNYTIGSSAAVAGVTTTEAVPFPEGLEFAAGTGLAVGVLGVNTVGAAAAAGFVTITITGYEY